MNEEDINIIICAEVEGGGNQVDGSVASNCSTCDIPIWISPSGQLLSAMKRARPVCFKCATDLYKTDPSATIEPLSKEQIEELQSAGVPFPELIQEELKKMMEGTMRGKDKPSGPPA